MPATSAHPSLVSGDRLVSIDALRGIAALYVLVFHVALIPQPSLAVPQWAARYVLTGGTGVTLFFIVSAFCLCLSMRTHQNESSPVTGFYLRRIFRVVPLFYFWIPLSWIRDWIAFDVHHPWWEVLLSATFAFNFVPGKNEGFVWAGWTLGVEMVFYLLFPFIFRYAGTLRKSLLFLAASGAIAYAYCRMATYLPIADAARESFMRTSILVQMPVFALGMVAFFVFERFIRGRALSRVWGFLLAVGAMLTYDSLIAGRLPPVFASIYGQGIIYSMLLIGLAVTPFGLLVNPVSRFYGKISYSVYLNHPTFVFVLTPVYRFVYSVDARPTIQYGTCLLLTLLILTAVAYGTYRLVERPGMRLGSFLMRRLGNGAPLPR